MEVGLRNKLIYFFLIFFFYISNIQATEFIESLKSLDKLYKSGSLSKEEFEKAKKIILNKYNQSDNFSSTQTENSKLTSNFNELIEIYNSLTYGPSDVTFKYKTYDGKFEKSAKWDDNFLGIFLKEENFVCILKHPYSLTNINIVNQSYENLNCSDGFKVKRGPARLTTGQGGKLYVISRNENQNIKFYLKVHYVYGQ